LALDGGKQAGAEVFLAVDRHRDGARLVVF
jgi:hypothetical protein